MTALSFRLRASAVLVAGCLMAFAMPPIAAWWLLFPCLSMFYYGLAGTAGWRSFLTGWLFGFGYFLIGLYWIGNALLVPGNEFRWVWPLAVAGLPFGLAFFTGAGAWAATRLSSLRTGRGFGVFAVCLMLSEWLRGTLFTGFPWNLYGYAWAHHLPMVQGASLIGAYGLSLLSVLWAAVPGFLFAARPRRATGLACCLAVVVTMAGLYGWGSVRLERNPTRNRTDIVVRVVQPDISQEDKLSGLHIADNLKTMVAASAAPFDPHKTYAIVWPETAISDTLIRDTDAARYIAARLMAGPGPRFLISGTLRHEGQSRADMKYFNSIVTYDRNLVPVSGYNKSHLVPFGEYIPFRDWIPLHPFAYFTGFTPGGGVATQTVPPLPPFGALICYEVIFPGAVVAKTHPRPQWIVNATNDGWYGDSAGPHQHFTMAIYRAVEEGLPLVRSANTGISAVIDPQGRILAEIPFGIRGAKDAALPFPARERTLYSIIGNASFLLLLLLIAGLARFFRR